MATPSARRAAVGVHSRPQPGMRSGSRQGWGSASPRRECTPALAAGSGCGPWRTGAGLPELGAISSEMKSEPAARPSKPPPHSAQPARSPLSRLALGRSALGKLDSACRATGGHQLGRSNRTERAALPPALGGGDLWGNRAAGPRGRGVEKVSYPCHQIGFKRLGVKASGGPLARLGYSGSLARQRDARGSGPTKIACHSPSASASIVQRCHQVPGVSVTGTPPCVCVWGVPCPLSPRLPSAEPAPSTAPGSGWQARPPPSHPGCAGRPGLVPLKATERLQDARRG